MIRGRRPQPPHLKLVKGNPGKRPVQPSAMDIRPLGEPPDGWSPEQRAVWQEIAEAPPPGILSRADRPLVELAARLLAQLRASPLVAPAVAGQLRQCFGELGMTPSARARLAVAPPAVANPFAALDP